MPTIKEMVDQLGALRAKIHPLATKAEAIEKKLKEKSRGHASFAFDGYKYRAVASTYFRTIPDIKKMRKTLSGPQFNRLMRQIQCQSVRVGALKKMKRR